MNHEDQTLNPHIRYEDLDFSLDEYQQLMIHHPETILNNEYLFRYGLETLFFIEDKSQRVVLLKLKEAQRRLLKEYFKLKNAAQPDEIGARIIILKSRQQGMTTLIAAICMFELMLLSNRSAIMMAHEKGSAAAIIFDIHKRFLQYFPFGEWDTFKRRRGDGYSFHNESDIDVEFEKPQGVVGRTTQFLHLSEAGRFRYLDTFLGSFIPGMPHLPISAAILESTAEKSGDAFHTMWQQAERGTSAWHPVFFPWYIDEDNVEAFLTDNERATFEESLNHRGDDTYGNEIALRDEYPEITLEHLKKRRTLITELPHGLASFKREFPTTPEEAFMGVNQPVFDIQVLRQYEKEQMIEPVKYGQMELGYDDMASQPTQFVEVPHGIIKVYKGPGEFSAGTQFMMGSDHSEGQNDWNAALIASQHPFEIVAEMIGYEGYNPIPREFARQMFHLGKWYNEAWICPENNPPGNTVVDLLLEWQYPNLMSETMIFTDKGNSNRYGWRNTADTRKAALERARETIKSMGVVIPSQKLLRQLEYFCTVTVGTGGANGGTRTRDQALKKGQHKAIGANVDEYSDDLIFAYLGLEHCRVALGAPNTSRKSYVETTRDAQGELWTTQTLPQIEDLFGENASQHESTKENWRDYA